MSRTIEEQSGVYAGRRHTHRGYYAGDFRDVPPPGPLRVIRVTRVPLEAGRGSAAGRGGTEAR